MIRDYRPEDLAELLDVWRQASLVAHPFLAPEFLDEEAVRIPERYLPHAQTSVFEEQGRVIGFIAMIGNVVGAIFVDPRRQQQGIGRRLMDSAKMSRNQLEVEVFEANSIGRAFYRAYGFQAVGKRIHEETGQPLLKLALEC